MIKLIRDLDPREYEHPLDKKALDTLHDTRGLDTLVKKFHEYGVEHLFNIQCTGSNLKVTAGSLPEVHQLVVEVCDTLSLAELPEIYIQHTEKLQGLVTGVDHPILIISSAALESLTPAENRFMIGRMVGHIKSQHVLYYEIGYLLPVLSNILAGPTLGFGSLLTMGLEVALLRWSRMSEYTADRAGLLACQDVAAATAALAKVAGLPQKYYDDFDVDGFIKQARAFQGYDETNYNRALKYASLMLGEQNWSVGRAHELLKWIDTGGYQYVLERKATQRRLERTLVKFCNNCGAKVPASTDFCPSCGFRFLI
ncbi:MAG: M48 family metallopeptidase [Bacteroidota bacterium]